MSKPKLDAERMASELSESSFFRDARRAQELKAKQSDSPTPSPATSEDISPGGQERPIRPKADTPKGVKAQTSKRLSTETRFDLNEQAPVRRGFYFSDEELMALDDLK